MFSRIYHKTRKDLNMNFIIKYTECSACHREVTIPACPNAKVALDAFETLIRLNRTRLKKIESITVASKHKKGPTNENKKNNVSPLPT
jgi:hypothetical protein